MEPKDADHSEFLQGVAYACAELVRVGEATYALEILRAAGITTPRDLRRAGVDEYDAKPCRKILRQP